MSDFFHENVPDAFIDEVLDIIKACPAHTFQILTKRSDRMLQITERIKRWPDNVWLGVTVESKAYKKRINHLRKVRATVKFLSCEPLLEDLGNLNLNGIDWVIVGGESGFNARIMEKQWATTIRDQCIRANIPYFFKQWGGMNKKASGRRLEGEEWNQMPAIDTKISNSYLTSRC
jgi:protein gp37